VDCSVIQFIVSCHFIIINYVSYYRKLIILLSLLWILCMCMTYHYMYVCVCMDVYMYVCIFICMCVCTHVSTHDVLYNYTMNAVLLVLYWNLLYSYSFCINDIIWNFICLALTNSISTGCNLACMDLLKCENKY
jgi:hypothetical protein